jgi:hypothetical protein
MKRIIWVHHNDYLAISKKVLKTLEKVMWCTHFIKWENKDIPVSRWMIW